MSATILRESPAEATLQAFGVAAFETVPWWLPITFVGSGIFLYSMPYLQQFIEARLSEWRTLPTPIRYPVIALLIGGSALIVFVELGQYDWMYVLFLLGYARAVEGATILHLFGRLDRMMQKLSGQSRGSHLGYDQTTLRGRIMSAQFGSGPRARSKVEQGIDWMLKRWLKRIPLIGATLLLIIISVGLLITVIFGFPDVPITVRLAAVVTISTLCLSIVNTAWILTKVTDILPPSAFLGVICCIVGAEMYNIPAVLSLFTGFPGLEGPFEAWTTAIVGTIGWCVGLVLAVAFFRRQIANA